MKADAGSMTWRTEDNIGVSEYTLLTVEEGKRLIDRLEQEHELSKAEMAVLIDANCPELRDYAKVKARAIGDKQFGRTIYIRGLIEFTNYCKNDCYYCGIRCSNAKAERYRLSREDIMACCREGKNWDFGHLCYKEAKIHIIPMTIL